MYSNQARYHESVRNLTSLGIEIDDAVKLRRIAMTLHRWHELECGDSNQYQSWCITRDEKTDKPYMERHYYQEHSAHRSRLEPIPDREKGARKRLAEIMARYPDFTAYVQGDPRGASLYILRPGDVPDGKDIDGYYSRGIAVYQ